MSLYGNKLGEEEIEKLKKFKEQLESTREGVWNGKRYVVAEHPVFSKYVVAEDDMTFFMLEYDNKILGSNVIGESTVKDAIDSAIEYLARK